MDTNKMIEKAKAMGNPDRALMFIQSQFNRSKKKLHRLALMRGWDESFPDKKGAIKTGVSVPPIRQLALQLGVTEVQIKQAIDIVKASGRKGVIAAAKEVLENSEAPQKSKAQAPSPKDTTKVCAFFIPSTGAQCKVAARPGFLTCYHHKNSEESVSESAAEMKELISEGEKET